MNLYEVNKASLSKDLGKDIPEYMVVIAKHQVMGLDDQQIGEILSATAEEIQEVTGDPIYKEVRERLSQIAADQMANQTAGWDAIESVAIEGLMKRLPYEKDAEFLLKVAAVANRATRKHQVAAGNVLDPGLRAGRTTITLTQRLVSKINNRGEQINEETRQLSIRDGSMSNPSFGDIDSLLTVKNSPVLPRALEIKTHSVEPSGDELLESFMAKGKGV